MLAFPLKNHSLDRLGVAGTPNLGQRRAVRGVHPLLGAHRARRHRHGHPLPRGEQRRRGQL